LTAFITSYIARPADTEPPGEEMIILIGSFDKESKYTKSFITSLARTLVISSSIQIILFLAKTKSWVVVN